MTIVLCDLTFESGEIRIIGCGNRYPVANLVSTDDESAGMKTCTTNGALEHLGILNGVAQTYIGRCLGITQLGGVFDGVRQIHLRIIWKTIGNGLTQHVYHIQRHSLNTCYVFNGIFSCHRAIGDDVRTVFVPVFIHNPTKHLSSTIIVEVGINIREVHTVGVKETLEQQIVFQWVDLGDTQTISHHRTRCGTTTRTYPHSKFLTGRVDEVLHYKEVARETHRFHYMKLEVDVFPNFIRQGVAIEFLSTIIGEFCQIVGFELDTIDLIIAT